MLYREFGNTGWQVSAIGMGTWNIGNQWGEMDDTNALATIHSAIAHGINIFDTAESYGIPPGLSEERLGKALTGIRHQVYLVSKIGSWGRRDGYPISKETTDNIRLCAYASLYRLRTDYIDALLCHEGEIEDPTVYLEGFEILKEQGHIRAYGISTNSLEVLKKFNVNNTCSVVETDYSLLNTKPESKMLPYCQEHGIAVMVRGPLAKGILSGKYASNTVFTDTIRSKWHSKEKSQQKFENNIAKVENLKTSLSLNTSEEMVAKALGYVISHPVKPVAIPGAKSPQQAATNAQAGAKLLSTEEREKMLFYIKNESKSSSKEAVAVGEN